MNTNRTQILHVNSSNRVSGKPNDFVITIPDSFIQNSDFDNTKIVVEPIQCVLPRAWDGVNSYNNTFTFYNVTDDISKTITIPCGNYNVYNFLLVLEHSLCCAEPFMVIGYDKLLNKFLFMTPKNNKVYQLIFNGNYSAFFLGFEPNDIITLDFKKGAIYSKNTVRMNLSTVILLHSDLPKTTNSAIDNLLSSSVQESDIFLKMPIDKPPYDTLIWRSQSTDIVSFEMQHANITKVRFYLTDEYSIPIPLEYDFTFSLRFTYVDLSAQDTLLNKIDRITQYLNYLVLEKTSKKHKKI